MRMGSSHNTLGHGYSSKQSHELIRALDRKPMKDFLFPQLEVCLKAWVVIPDSFGSLWLPKACWSLKRHLWHSKRWTLSSSHYPDFSPLKMTTSELTGLLYISPQCPPPLFFFLPNLLWYQKAVTDGKMLNQSTKLQWNWILREYFFHGKLWIF